MLALQRCAVTQDKYTYKCTCPCKISLFFHPPLLSPRANCSPSTESLLYSLLLSVANLYIGVETCQPCSGVYKACPNARETVIHGSLGLLIALGDCRSPYIEGVQSLWLPFLFSDIDLLSNQYSFSSTYTLLIHTFIYNHAYFCLAVHGSACSDFRNPWFLRQTLSSPQESSCRRNLGLEANTSRH